MYSDIGVYGYASLYIRGYVYLWVLEYINIIMYVSIYEYLQIFMYISVGLVPIIVGNTCKYLGFCVFLYLNIPKYLNSPWQFRQKILNLPAEFEILTRFIVCHKLFLYCMTKADVPKQPLV